MKLSIIAGMLVTAASTESLAQRAPADSAPPHGIPTTPRTPPGRPLHHQRVSWADSVMNPESVIHDAVRDVFYVTNINGASLAKDGNGFITRLKADGTRDVTKWIASGMNGVTLHAPKGMAIVGDTLWVTDIDVVRGFNILTGRTVATVDLEPMDATFLNDITSRSDGSIYVTDSKQRPDATGAMIDDGVDRIYRIAGGRAQIVMQTERLSRPNGIAWDAQRNRFLIVSIASDTVMAWPGGNSALVPLVTGPGMYDGVVVTPGGRVFISSKATGSIHELRGNRLVKLLENLGDVADMGWDDKRGRLAVPLTSQNRVELYAVGQQ